MATLKYFMGDLKRGDGRKFRKNKWFDCYWFEPIFKDFNDDWYGLDQDNVRQSFCHSDSVDWQPYIESNEKKKIKLYRYILKNRHTNLYSVNAWQSNSPGNYHYDYQVVGTEEMEIEVDE
jgi:hypothetical protein